MKTFAAASILAVVFLASSAASAAQATVVLRDGDIFTGDVVELVNGHHVTIRLANGETKTTPWDQVFTVKFDMDSGAKAASPSPAPLALATSPSSAPVVAFAPTKPAADQPSSAPTTKSNGFDPRPTIGVRVGLLSPGGDFLKANGRTFAARDLAGDGGLFGIDAGVHFSPAWTFFVAYEYGALADGKAAGADDLSPTSHYVGVGLKAHSNPRGAGFFFDIGAGYRWLRFPSKHETSVAGGFEPLRVAIGAALVVDRRFRMDLALGTSVGSLTRFDIANGCVNASSSDCDSIPTDNQTWHTFTSLSLGGAFDL